jgi:hypothetical protein
MSSVADGFKMEWRLNRLSVSLRIRYRSRAIVLQQKIVQMIRNGDMQKVVLMHNKTYR